MNNKLIKKSVLSLSIILSTQLLAVEVSPKKELLEDIKAQTKQCIVQVVSRTMTDNENVVGYKSLCQGFKILSTSEAQIYIEGEWYTAIIAESPESDGGDLDDLNISNSKGQTVATKSNIAAYDSVVVAMAGDTEFRKMYSK